MKYARGKIFASNPKMFKKESALFFPNFWGYTLDREEAEITSVMKGKISVVCVFSRRWAEEQCSTFVGGAQNPELWNTVKENSDLVRFIDISVEESLLSRSILWVFSGNIKKEKKEPFQKYFVLKRIKERVRQVLGMINHKSGYVYLVDPECKIRWAGSGDAWEGEKESLAAGVRRLIEQQKAARLRENA